MRFKTKSEREKEILKGGGNMTHPIRNTISNFYNMWYNSYVSNKNTNRDVLEVMKKHIRANKNYKEYLENEVLKINKEFYMNQELFKIIYDGFGTSNLIEWIFNSLSFTNSELNNFLEVLLTTDDAPWTTKKEETIILRHLKEQHFLSVSSFTNQWSNNITLKKFLGKYFSIKTNADIFKNYDIGEFLRYYRYKRKERFKFNTFRELESDILLFFKINNCCISEIIQKCQGMYLIIAIHYYVKSRNNLDSFISEITKETKEYMMKESNLTYFFYAGYVDGDYEWLSSPAVLKFNQFIVDLGEEHDIPFLHTNGIPYNRKAYLLTDSRINISFNAYHPSKEYLYSHLTYINGSFDYAKKFIDYKKLLDTKKIISQSIQPADWLVLLMAGIETDNQYVAEYSKFLHSTFDEEFFISITRVPNIDISAILDKAVSINLLDKKFITLIKYKGMSNDKI